MKAQRVTFDYVTLFQVLEHIYDVKSALGAACELLKPGGRLVIAVPNNNPYLFRFQKYHTLNLRPHHVGWWNKDSLRNIHTALSAKPGKVIGRTAV